MEVQKQMMMMSILDQSQKKMNLKEVKNLTQRSKNKKMKAMKLIAKSLILTIYLERSLPKTLKRKSIHGKFTMKALI